MAQTTIKTANSSWTGTAAADKVYISLVNKVRVNTGGGNDSIYTYGSRATITTGAGNDTITNYGDTVSIDAGAGNDSIYSYSYYSTIGGGNGNDTILLSTSGHHNVIQYASGGGNDVLYNLGATDSISISGGSYTRSTVGSDVVLTVGNGSITLKNAKGKTINVKGGMEIMTSPIVTIGGGKNISNSKNITLLTGTDYNDTVKNTGNGVRISVGAGNDSVYTTKLATIDAGAGDDTIQNLSAYSSIRGGAGNDSIYSRAGGAFIYGDAGNDTIKVSGQGNYILGGADNDFISVTGSGNRIHGEDGNDTINVASSSTAITISGGTGNDLIKSNNGVDRTFLYASGDGNDTIENYKGGTISITGANYTRSTVGSNVVLTVGTGSIIVKDGKNKTITVKGTLAGGGSSTTIGGNGGSTLRNTLSNKTIYGTGYADSIYNSSSGNKVTITTGAGNDTITNYGDTVSIDGGAGNDSIYSYSYYSTIGGGNGNDIISLSTSGHHNVIQYVSGGGNDVLYNLGSTDSISISGGSYTRSTVGNDVVLNVGDGSIIIKDGKTKTINVIPPAPVNVGVTIDNTLSNRTLTGTDYADSIRNSGSYVKINALDGNDFIYSSNNRYGGAYVTINAGDGNDTIAGRFGDSSISGGAGADLVSMTGDVDRATINAGTGNDTIYSDNGDGKNIFQYASGDGFDVLYNIGSGDTISITSGTYTRSTVGNDVVLNVGDGSITVKDGKNKSFSVAPVPTVPPDTVPSDKIISGTSGNDYISVSIAGAVVYADGGNDTVYNSGHNDVTIYGGDGADSIKVWYADNMSVAGGAGNDRVSIRGNNAVIDGGADNDIIYNNGTGASISGGEGNDSIGNYGNNARIFVGNGDDTIYNSGTGASISGDAGNDRIYCTGSNNTILAGNDNDSIYVSSNDNGFVDTGAGNDTIKAWYGSNVTLKGGAGNDFVSVRGGSYVIAYSDGDGSDTVVGFDGNDTLKVYGSYTRSTVGNDVVLNVGSGSITLKNAKNKLVNISNLYGSADLFDSDNFLTTGAQLDDITDSFSACSLVDFDTTAQSLKTLSKQNTLVAYASK